MELNNTENGTKDEPMDSPEAAEKGTENEIATQHLQMNERCCLIVLGLCVGDCLGATSEFEIPWNVAKNCVETYPGWPSKLVGGGRKDKWKIGEPTDDSAQAIELVRSYFSLKCMDPKDIALRFVAWYNDRPKGIGNTTAFVLTVLNKMKNLDKDGWLEGSKRAHKKNPDNAANGSLMRNGAIAALFPRADQEIDALDATVLHGIVTHLGPLPVLTCIVQTLLIRKALLSKEKIAVAPTLNDIKELLKGPWKEWQKNTKNKHCKQWLNFIGSNVIAAAEEQLVKELQGFEEYDPWHQDYRKRSGYCVLTLLLSLWALHWSFKDSHPPLPDWFKNHEWIFKRHGFDTIMWVVSIGADADTYAASGNISLECSVLNVTTAGPLLAAFHPKIAEDFLTGLQLRNEINELFGCKWKS